MGLAWFRWDHADLRKLIGQFGEIVKAEAGILQYEWARKYAKNGEPCIRAVGPFGIERVIFLTPQAAQQSACTSVRLLLTIKSWSTTGSTSRDLTSSATRWARSLVMVCSRLRATTTSRCARCASGPRSNAGRSYRQMMTPAFSSAHLAQLVDMFYPPLEACVRVLDKQIEEKGGKGAKSAVMDVYHIMSRTTASLWFQTVLTIQLDIICDTAFGLKANSLEKGHELADAYEQLIDLQSGQVRTLAS